MRVFVLSAPHFVRSPADLAHEIEKFTARPMFGASV